MAMHRKISPVIALALGLGAAPVLAQSAPAPAAAPEDSTAARTLEQNRRVLIEQPAPSGVGGTATEPGAPAARVGRAGAAPAVATGRAGLPAGGRPGPRGGA
jgi:hypothetical protein